MIAQTEGLPNITGGTDSTDAAPFVWSGGDKNTSRTYGALGVKAYSKWGASVGGTSGAFVPIVFDASVSNKIYGSSSHVTPLNTSIRIWKRTA